MVGTPLHMTARSARFRLITLVAFGALCNAITCVTAHADPVEEFYKGKELQLYVGNPPGGGFQAVVRGRENGI